MQIDLKKATVIFAIPLLAIVVELGFVIRQRGAWPQLSLTPQPTVTTLPKVTVAENKKVSGFPDFPTYPNATLTSTQQTQTTSAPEYNQQSYQAYLETDDSPTTVMNWYVENLSAAGWKIARPLDATDSNDQNIIMYKDALSVTINVEKETDEGTTIAIYIK